MIDEPTASHLVDPTPDEGSVGLLPGLVKLFAIVAGIVLLIVIASFSLAWYHELSQQAERGGGSLADTRSSTRSTRSCREYLQAVAADTDPVSRSDDFLFEVDDLGGETRAWYVGESEGRLAYPRLENALQEIRCFQGWRLPTAAELRTLARKLPPKALPEGVWTSEDDGLGIERKIYFPASDEYEFRGGAHTWWMVAVTDTPVIDEE